MKKSFPFLFLSLIILSACQQRPVDEPAEKEASSDIVDRVPDYAREKRMADEIVDAIFDGEPIWLDANGRKFLGIDTQPQGQSTGAVIILHGRGFHPDWEDAIHPLRTKLPEHGWRTLSLQMPVLEKSAKYYDYVPLFKYSHARIEAGINYLREQGESTVVLLAHSCGAHMAMDWVADKGDSMIDAYIGAGMGATDYKQPMLGAFPLDKMKVPVLDVYGKDEYPAVIKMAPERREMLIAAGNALSGQVVIPDADHYFTGKGNELVDVVVEWLSEL